jgi:hypothetical protein
MRGWLVAYKFGGTFDRLPLTALGIVDDVRTMRGVEELHIRPVYAPQGSPLPKWLQPGQIVSVLNAEAPAFASAS